MSAELIQVVEEYIKYEPNAEYKQIVTDLYAAKDFEKLKANFLPRIAFGTAGLRSKMSWGYRNMNELVILQTTQGICKAIINEFGAEAAQERGVVIGYDGRYNSEKFANIVASLFIQQNIKVYLFEGIVATPFVPFGVTNVGACCGIMVTASHNPKDDNGYKVYWANGVQIIPPTDGIIAETILQNLVPWNTEIAMDVKKVADPNNKLQSQDVMNAIKDAYFASIKQNCCFNYEQNKSAEIKAVYTAMHGVGAQYTARAFETFGLPAYIPVVPQVDPNPDFPTVKFPNPEEKGALDIAIQYATDAQATLIVANDPDADRLAVATRADINTPFTVLTGNEIAALFADYNYHQFLQKNKHLSPEELKAAKKDLLMIASTVSSKQLKSFATIEGLEFRDTLTGFKWIGNEAKNAVEKQQKTILVAYEVEIGFAVGSTSFDKDGVRTAAQMYELANFWWVNNKQTLQDRLAQFADKYGHFKMTNLYVTAQPPQINAVAAALRNYKGTNTYPTTCGQYKIISTRDVTLGLDTAFADGKSILPTAPEAQMLTFTFENGATCTLRNSGTEPKLKYYVEVVDYKSAQIAEALLKDMTETIIAEFITPYM